MALKWREQGGGGGGGSELAQVLSMSEFKDQLAARGQKLRNGETEEKQEGEGTEEEENGDEDKEITALLYNAMDLTLRERKLNQVAKTEIEMIRSAAQYGSLEADYPAGENKIQSEGEETTVSPAGRQ
eukprot:363-Hanusia_phi.AAC.1